ncbi:chemotaxis protein CheW [Duganella callida]|uniref:Chemotaxis protein CheW n=1 Tax=Duganella callida TaxID=2561932 RepID=A0A4Y9SR29_9BURK|nr:chemotaxis protein CheW [Duganella callida]TFW27093.1 chemotaxis protein CheW [Duganella callida]
MPDSTAAATPFTELFGSFLLGEDEFALPASCFREVVNFPDKVTAVPLSPKFLEGMFTLRGTVVPMVNLGRVFNPEARAARPSDKIAILDYQGVLVGMLFDATGEILRVRPEQRSTLSYADGEKRGVVAGTILLDHGTRLVQVLDPDALVRIENVPQVLALQSAGKQAVRRLQGERRQCVSFRVGASSFAFEMGAIQEIIRVPELQTSVLNSSLCLGRINFRGSPVAVVDFATLLNVSAPRTAAEAGRDFSPDQRVIVARIDDATIGFLVDSVDNIINYYSEEVMPIPLLSKARAGMFAGCLSKPELGDVFLLDHHQIFSSSEIKDMRAGHANLYPKDDAAAAKIELREKQRGQRKVYITFALENSYAVEIKQVREIIDLGVGDITRPPGLPAFMRGMLNLRQQMVSVIDLRSLYGMPPLEDTSQSKILVVDRGDECFGLMVDAVENIMTINDNRRFGAPKMMRNVNVKGDPRAEMDDVIDIGEGDEHKTLSVFECDRLIERLAKEMPALAA